MMAAKETLITELINNGYLKTPLIIESFRAIDRKDFVPPELAASAYANEALPIGFGQTISQPLVVAFMLELLQPKTGEHILDIGSGSGWKATLLAYMVSKPVSKQNGRVITIERISGLAKIAGQNIAKYGFVKKGVVKILTSDGTRPPQNLMPKDGYDKIIAGAAGAKIPESWKKQLKIGGRIVAPVDDTIMVLDKLGRGRFREKIYHGFRFVPLIAG